MPRKRISRPSAARTAGADFFISHAQEDIDFAELLSLRIQEEGYGAWMASEQLRGGEDWRLEIDESIRNAAALLAVMTPIARSSEYVTYEWAFAWGVGVRVIPIVLKPTPLHPRLAGLQYLDFTNHGSRPWDRLAGALHAAGQASHR